MSIISSTDASDDVEFEDLPDPYHVSDDEDPYYIPTQKCKKQKRIKDFLTINLPSTSTSKVAVSEPAPESSDQLTTNIKSSCLLDGKFFEVISQIRFVFEISTLTQCVKVLSKRLIYFIFKKNIVLIYYKTNRSTAVRRIDQLHSNMCHDIKEKLKDTDYVCTTTDIWSSKSRSFLGVTCHWLDENLTRHSAALACKRFEGTHSYDRIADILDEINKSFNLSANKIMATITDNGSNFVKCFKEFGLINNTSYTPADDDFNLPPTNDEIDSDIYPDFNFNETVFDESNAERGHRLWNKAGRPKSSEIIKNLLGHTFSIPGVTRWNSLYDAVQKILKSKEKLPLLCERLMIAPFRENEILFLEEYIQIMKPLAETLDFLQGEENTYYGYLLPSIVSMRTKMQKLKLSNEIEQLLRPLDFIIDSIDRRFAFLLTLKKESRTAVIAAVLCPRFKIRWYNVFKNTEISTTSKEIQSWVIEAIEASISEAGFKTPEKQIYNDNDPFFDFKEDTESFSSSAGNLLVDAKAKSQSELELLKYLNDQRTSLSMLDDYKYIKIVFRKYNTILPSSAPVERLFSFAQIINAPRRHALSDSNFEKLVTLKANKF
ncbi:unnamed protein product [Brassicogethes aeneus]|uniref:Transposase n=1 Tax=Brassicogethes aeneus TaxID=1431903 RepID=A0A9P0BHC4_BRAAE|nr:unnamed protein product [Brassicogethes aeneus]